MPNIVRIEAVGEDLANMDAYGIRLNAWLDDDRLITVPIVWSAFDVFSNVGSRGVSALFQSLMTNGINSLMSMIEELDRNEVRPAAVPSTEYYADTNDTHYYYSGSSGSIVSGSISATDTISWTPLETTPEVPSRSTPLTDEELEELLAD